MILPSTVSDRAHPDDTGLPAGQCVLPQYKHSLGTAWALSQRAKSLDLPQIQIWLSYMWHAAPGSEILQLDIFSWPLLRSLRDEKKFKWKQQWGGGWIQLSRSSRGVPTRDGEENYWCKSQLQLQSFRLSYWPSNISETLTSDWAASSVVSDLGKWWGLRGFGFVQKTIGWVSPGRDHPQPPAEFRDQSQAIITELTPLCIHVQHWMTVY